MNLPGKLLKGAAHAAVWITELLLMLRVRIKSALGHLGPLEILSYPGYGSASRATISGRVVEAKRIPSPEKRSLATMLLAMYRRLSRLPIPNALLTATLHGQQRSVRTDSRGFFTLVFDPPEAREIWQHVALELESSPADSLPVRADGRILVPPPDARFVIISDVDDTVVPTGATNFLRMMYSLFLRDPRTRLPFPGVAALYRSLHHDTEGRPHNPILYVSRGPWNLFDLISEFFTLHDIPVGPVLYLRHWGLSREGITKASPQGHKFALIEEMLATYRELPFILFGDSGQLDPEIYAEIVRAHPGRVAAVYIRDVTRNPERTRAIRTLGRAMAEAGSPLVLAEDSMEMANHAAEAGFIESGALAEVVGEKVVGHEPPELLTPKS